MNLVIGCDLSTKCSGYSIFDKDAQVLIKFGQFKPKTTLTTLGKICYITGEFYKLFDKWYNDGNNVSVVIEDIYLAYHRGKNQVLGFANLARLSGAIMAVVKTITGQRIDDVVQLRMAVQARPMVNLKGNCQKAEVQSWAIGKFTDLDNSSYEAMIDAVMVKKQLKTIDNKEFKKRMEAISKIIEDETEISEDIADALLLGYGEVIKK
jgi:hypothetical protein